VTPDLKVMLDRPALRVRLERRVNKAQRDRLDWRGQKAIRAQPGREVTPDLKVTPDRPALRVRPERRVN
jgi:hypothetical protein